METVTTAATRPYADCVWCWLPLQAKLVTYTQVIAVCFVRFIMSFTRMSDLCPLNLKLMNNIRDVVLAFPLL